VVCLCICFCAPVPPDDRLFADLETETLYLIYFPDFGLNLSKFEYI